ncbi:MAG: carboxypeptidase regulatory-like domain-containing protein [Acidobacteria bacterium]|nr:carboxypeptidase regulatory-like domain-containing protein [Acidobacteriota bacterium]
MIYGPGAAGSTQLCRNASNEISTCSSSRRYKNNIVDFQPGLSIIDRLRPVTFNWNVSNQADMGLSQFSHPIGFWAPEVLIPTAASVSVSGRVLMAGGAGIRNAVVTLTDSNGLIRTTVTGSLGRYAFAEVEVGQVYVIAVRSKRFRFTDPARIISVDDHVVDLDFVSEGQ